MILQERLVLLFFRRELAFENLLEDLLVELDVSSENGECCVATVSAQHRLEVDVVNSRLAVEPARNAL